MEIILHIYFAINLMILGSYLLNEFNHGSKAEKFFISVLLFFCGGIFVIWELTLARSYDKWYENSSFRFYFEFYCTGRYSNLEPSILENIKGQILREKENKDKESKRLVKHLTKILDRHDNNKNKNQTE